VAATGAKVKLPGGIWLDDSTNLYFADTGNHRIRRVDAATGSITTVAGSGSGGYAGDGGPALSASLKSPADVCLDASNSLYIADTGNHVVRRVDAATGTITTFAGNGLAEFSNDGRLATLAGLYSPGGVGVDASLNVYIADTGNHRIRKVDAATQKISTLAGKGYGDPLYVAGYPKDGSLAKDAYLLYPAAMWTNPKATAASITRR
jgi:trimeric autotransporter adhesin